MQNIVLDLLTWEKLLRLNSQKTTSSEASDNLKDVADSLRKVANALVTGKDEKGKPVSPQDMGQRLLRLWRVAHDQEWQFSTLSVLGDEANHISLTLSFLRDTAENLLREDYIRPEKPLKIPEIEKLMNPIGICSTCRKVVELRAGLCPFCKKKTKLLDPEKYFKKKKKLEFIPEQEIDYEKLAPSTIFMYNPDTDRHECKNCGYAAYDEGDTKDPMCRDLKRCPKCGLKDERTRSGPRVFIAPASQRIAAKKAAPARAKDKEYNRPRMLKMKSDKREEKPGEKEEAKHVAEEAPSGLGKTAWPCVGGNARRNGRGIYPGPTRGKISWKVDLGKTLSAPPLVGDGGNVYLGTVDRGFVQITKNGKIGWEFHLTDPVLSGACIGANGNIFFGTITKFYSLNPDGTTRWSVRKGCVHSPVLTTDGSVIFASKDTLYCFDRDSKLKWEHNFGEAPPGKNYDLTPALDSEDNIYVTTNQLNIFSPEGELKNQIQLIGGGTAPAIDERGLIYVGTENMLKCISSNGSLRWEYEVRDLVSTPPCFDREGNIYFGTSKTGSIYSIDPEAMRRWEHSVGSPIVGPLTTDSQGSVYFVDQNSNLYCIDNSGRKSWRVCSKSLIFLGGGNFNPSPAIGAGHILFATCQNGKLYAIK